MTYTLDEIRKEYYECGGEECGTFDEFLGLYEPVGDGLYQECERLRELDAMLENMFRSWMYPVRG